MISRITTVVSMAALLLTIVWHPSAGYLLLLESVICVGAIVIVLQAGRAEKYLWAVGFALIAVLFNPIAPVPMARSIWIDLAVMAAFGVSLAVAMESPAVTESVSQLLYSAEKPGSVK